MNRILAVALALAACASAPKSSPTTGKPVETAKHDDHANLPPEVIKFHDVLAPRWHAEKGPQRTKDTCAEVSVFTSIADALTKAATPSGGDAMKWSSATKELADAVATLKTTCDTHDETAFEDAFHHVHVGFHHVAEAAGGEPEHHEDEGHHDEGHDE